MTTSSTHGAPSRACRSFFAAAVLSLPALSAAQPPVGWRMDGTGNYPTAKPAVEWSPTEHVLWATPMPKWSNSSPILVGDRLYVSSEPDTLLCLSAVDGRILWQQRNPVVQAVPAQIAYHPASELPARLHETRSAVAQKEYQLTALRQQLRKSPGDERATKEVAALEKELASLRLSLGSLAFALKPSGVHDANGYSTPTPASDGSFVYAVFGTGVVAAYDLDGKRRWIRFGDQSQVPNGAAASPVLVGGKVLVLFNDLIAFDAATGEVAWRANVPGRYGTPIAFKIEGEDVVVLPSGHCVRVADGAILASGLGDLEYAAPLVRDGVLYMIQGTAQAFAIPGKMSDPLEFRPLWSTKLKGERYYSSPLLLDGLLYAITRTQIFNVVDATTGELVYAERLRLGEKSDSDSVYTSITQGGSYVFVSGFEGATAVLRPGRQYQQVALNHLAPFRSNPVFDGDRMYVRTNDKFYCVSSSASRTETQEAAR